MLCPSSCQRERSTSFCHHTSWENPYDTSPRTVRKVSTVKQIRSLASIATDISHSRIYQMRNIQLHHNLNHIRSSWLGKRVILCIAEKWFLDLRILEESYVVKEARHPPMNANSLTIPFIVQTRGSCCGPWYFHLLWETDNGTVVTVGWRNVDRQNGRNGKEE